MADSQTVLWRNLFRPGAECCTLAQIPGGWMLRGSAIVALKRNRPLQFDYEVRCNTRWQTRSVRVFERPNGHVLTLRVDARQRWWRGKKELKLLRGCQDVDLFFSPSTNTLPIRRLRLPHQGSEEVIAAWVASADFSIKLLRQRYTRVARNRYRYASANGFRSEITVDTHGLVVNYPPAWQRAAVHGA